MLPLYQGGAKYQDREPAERSLFGSAAGTRRSDLRDCRALPPGDPGATGENAAHRNSKRLSDRKEPRGRCPQSTAGREAAGGNKNQSCDQLAGAAGVNGSQEPSIALGRDPRL